MSDMNRDTHSGDIRIAISISEQRLRVFESGRLTMDVAVSTAKNGAGEQMGSERTPRGRHVIRAKIGAGCPVNAVFVARRPTGEIYTPELGARHPGRDWILTRILWLCGREAGRNRFGQVDTMRRYIYIHGSPDHVPMGAPGSRGCVRMRNAELLELFERVPAGTPVDIDE